MLIKDKMVRGPSDNCTPEIIAASLEAYVLERLVQARKRWLIKLCDELAEEGEKLDGFQGKS